MAKQKTARKPPATHAIEVLRSEAAQLRREAKLDAHTVRLHRNANKVSPSKKRAKALKAWEVSLTERLRLLNDVRLALRQLGDA